MLLSPRLRWRGSFWRALLVESWFVDACFDTNWQEWISARLGM